MEGRHLKDVEGVVLAECIAVGDGARFECGHVTAKPTAREQEGVIGVHLHRLATPPTLDTWRMNASDAWGTVEERWG